MGLRKGSEVVYPKHGAGKIVAKTTETIGGEKVEYFKVEFLKSPTTVSVPVEKAEEMGLRRPLKEKELKKELRNIGKKVKITKKTLKTIDATAKEKLASGKVEDIIDLVNLLRSIARKKEKENKNFSYTYSTRLEIAVDFILSEIETVLGKRAVDEYIEKYELE